MYLLERDTAKNIMHKISAIMRKNIETHLNVIVPVVVQVDNAVELAVHGDVDVVGVGVAFAQGLAGVFLHLNVVELSIRKKKTYIKNMYHQWSNRTVPSISTLELCFAIRDLEKWELTDMYENRDHFRSRGSIKMIAIDKGSIIAWDTRQFVSSLEVAH